MITDKQRKQSEYLSLNHPNSLLLKWSINNSKLIKTRVASFPLPAIKSCPMAGICKQYCFTDTGRYHIPIVMDNRLSNLKDSRKQSFISKLLHDIQILSSKYRTIRIHDSGDFYNKKYYNQWLDIIQEFQTIRFYCYTKSTHLIDWDSVPNNFRIVQSMGGKLDSEYRLDKPIAKVFLSLDTMKKEGYRNGTNTDYLASIGYHRIGLLPKGIKNRVIQSINEGNN